MKINNSKYNLGFLMFFLTGVGCAIVTSVCLLKITGLDFKALLLTLAIPFVLFFVEVFGRIEKNQGSLWKTASCSRKDKALFVFLIFFVMLASGLVFALEIENVYKMIALTLLYYGMYRYFLLLDSKLLK
jgi:hypothetical protein